MKHGHAFLIRSFSDNSQQVECQIQRFQNSKKNYSRFCQVGKKWKIPSWFVLLNDKIFGVIKWNNLLKNHLICKRSIIHRVLTKRRGQDRTDLKALFESCCFFTVNNFFFISFQISIDRRKAILLPRASICLWVFFITKTVQACQDKSMSLLLFLLSRC